MEPRQRVIDVIAHKKPDRIPLYGWLAANMSDPINERFGSVAAFEDHYEFDLAHLWGGAGVYAPGEFEALRDGLNRPVEPADLLELTIVDPNDSAAYDGVREQVDHHGTQRGRFTYIQTPGLFEAHNRYFGIENHLAWLLLFPDDLKKVYARQAEWNKAFALNCLECGVDMIHVSDDWGAERGLLFSPDVWWEMMYPYHKVTTDAVKAAGGYASLHCDGCFMDVVDGVIKLGYDVVHPWQESAGMPLEVFKDRWAGTFTVLGGLDVQRTIGFGRLDQLKADIQRVMRMFSGGGLLFCTTHFVQNHCTIDELVLAYDTAYELSREVTRGH